MSLKGKAIKGFSWTVLEGIFSQGIVFSVGIVLARILSPKDFGLIGIITAFIAVSNSIIEGGFGSALVRKPETKQIDYNTVFFSNLFIAVVLYILLFVSSGTIASYFKEPQLELLLKYASIILVINSFSIIQQTLLVKSLDFKTQGIVAIIASAVSGAIAVIMAYSDYGVWSLVALAISRPLIKTILLWFSNKWFPSYQFSKKSFTELFNFGYKLLAANLLNTLYKNIYYVLIGKYFSPTSLGYYTRADQFQAPFSTNIALAIRRISFPVMSTIQDDDIRLKQVFIKFIRFSAFINFTIMLCLAAMAKPIVLLLIGAKWETSIFYLQLLCIPGILYPLQILNLNLLAVKGYSNLYLKLEVIKKFILLPMVFITVLFSIEVMLYGLIIFSFIEYYINSYYTRLLIDLSFKQQLKTTIPFLLIAVFNFFIMYLITWINELSLFQMLIIQLIVGAVTLIVVYEIFKLSEYLEFKGKLIQYLKQVYNRGNTKKL